MENGKQYMLYKDYTYCFAFKTKAGCRWRCTLTSECKAYIMLDSDGTLLKADGIHAHRKYEEISENAEVKEITMMSGKKFQMLKGYTYGGPFKLKTSMRYRCTMGCGVSIYKSFDGHLMDPIPSHDHPPPKLFLTSSGVYVALR